MKKIFESFGSTKRSILLILDLQVQCARNLREVDTHKQAG